MTDQEINIAIAIASGWGEVEILPSGRICGLKRFADGSLGKEEFDYVPDYCHDLNAMNKAEETLERVSSNDWDAYLTALGCKSDIEKQGWICWVPQIRATARQRAEAFLRVKGLWK